jgi:hypothetical protein
MNLNLIALPGPAKNLAEAHIEQRIQVPHVPLKFNSQAEDATLLAIIDDPVSTISLLDTGQPLQLHILNYNSTMSRALEAKYIYRAHDILGNIDNFIMNLFNNLNLDEENYKNKTGRESLRNDVLNKKNVFVEPYTIQTNKEDQVAKLQEYNLEKSWELYNSAQEKAINI